MQLITKQGDNIELMKELPDCSIDLIIDDLPYGKTKNKWDTPINLPSLWEQYERIIKPNGAIILFGIGSFSAKLILSNEELYRYTIIWEKTNPTGYLNAKKMPLRSHEDMLVFYKELPTYNPQMTHGHVRKVSKASHKTNSKKTTNYGDHGLTTYDSTSRYPKSIWKFKSDKQKEALHPTQKPVKLIEELIKTFSNPGDTVLDSVAGSGTTGIAALNTDRKAILFEKYDTEFEILTNRIKIYESTKALCNSF